jgi:pseudouridine-5'-phosphate glycosidase
MFEVEFSEEKPFETVQDKKTRREMEKENFIGNPVTFVMEDKELGEEEAKEYIKKVKEQNAELGLNSKQDTPIGGVASRILGSI